MATTSRYGSSPRAPAPSFALRRAGRTRSWRLSRSLPHHPRLKETNGEHEESDDHEQRRHAGAGHDLIDAAEVDDRRGDRGNEGKDHRPADEAMQDAIRARSPHQAARVRK